MISALTLVAMFALVVAALSVPVLAGVAVAHVWPRKPSRTSSTSTDRSAA